MAEIIVLILVVLVLDGCVSAAEAALLSVSPSRIETARIAGRAGAERLARLKERVERPLGTLIVLSNIVTIMGAFVVGVVSADRFGNMTAGIVSFILTVLVIVFAEVVPKILGEHYADAVALAFAPALTVLTEALSPFVDATNRIAAFFTSGAPARSASEEEITAMASMGVRSGAIESAEATMIQRVFRLNDITARDLMTPRKRVVWLEGGKTLTEIREKVLVTTSSRLLVTSGPALDNVIGIVHQRDILRALESGHGGELVLTLAAKPLFVPGSMPADELVREFQKQQKHLGVVMNEHGEVSGVVTIKDCLEELVGEMIDEKDVEPELIKRVSKDEILVHGETKCRYVNSLFQTSLPDTKSLNGFIQAQFHRIPEKDETLPWKDLRFIVEEVSGGEIRRVRVIRTVAEPAGPHAAKANIPS